MKIDCPKAVTALIDRLHDAGYEAYVVGGSLRDRLLGRTPHDWDITTSALPEQTLALFHDYRTIPTGMKHGTVTVMADGEPIEITTYRIDGDYLDARRPESVSFTRNLADDLSRRDFTVCAMAWSPYAPGDGIVDLFDGRSDLDARIIRCVGDPERRFTEDALRILRAYRFTAQLSFTLDDATRDAARRLAPRLSLISVERIYAELSRTLLSENVVATMTMMVEDGILELIAPDFDPRAIPLLPKLPAELPLRLAILCRHLSPTQLNAQLTALRCPGSVIRRVTAALSLFGISLDGDFAKSARRLLRAGGSVAARDLLALRAASGEETADYELALTRALERGDCTDLAHLALSGADLAELGVPRGPAIGSMLNRLLDAVIEDPTRNEAHTLRKLVRELREQQ
ncbi:MAG: CCA tRNA nucleotidyltransferase [Clostridia bacterium]|nr:CCA tRNA nucleotidyltransferase [Clostridia bacterium]